MCSRSKTLYWPYPRNVWSDWHVMKCIIWILGHLCDCDLWLDFTHDLDLGFLKVRFWNSCISGIVDLIDVKKKKDPFDIGLTVWPCPLTIYPWSWPWIFKVKVWNSLISGMGGLTDQSFKIVIFGWPFLGGWMYRIVTAVTSEVDVLSTHLVCV